MVWTLRSGINDGLTEPPAGISVMHLRLLPTFYQGMTKEMPESKFLAVVMPMKQNFFLTMDFLISYYWILRRRPSGA